MGFWCSRLGLVGYCCFLSEGIQLQSCSIQIPCCFWCLFAVLVVVATIDVKCTLSSNVGGVIRVGVGVGVGVVVYRLADMQ